MGNVSSTIQELDGVSARTVEPRATVNQSLSLSIDTPLEVAQPQKPEVAHKPVIVQHPSVLAPLSQIRTGEGSLFLPSVESSKEPENRSTAAVNVSFYPRTGNRNPDYITQNVRRGVSAHIMVMDVSTVKCL